MSYQPSYGHGMKYKTYAIVSYNNYLQPPLLGMFNMFVIVFISSFCHSPWIENFSS